MHRANHTGRTIVSTTARSGLCSKPGLPMLYLAGVERCYCSQLSPSGFGSINMIRMK